MDKFVIMVYERIPDETDTSVIIHGIFKDFDAAFDYIESNPKYEMIDWLRYKAMSSRECRDTGIYYPNGALYHCNNTSYVFIRPVLVNGVEAIVIL